MSGRLKSFVWRQLRKLGIQVQYYYHVVSDLGDLLPDIRPPIDLRVRRVPEPEVRSRLPGFDDATSRHFEYLLSRGSWCYFAEHEGKLAGYSWVDVGGRHVCHCQTGRIPSGAVYSGNSFVFPEFRGNKVFQYLITCIYRELRQEGFRRAFNFVHPRNKASVRARWKFHPRYRHALLIVVPRLKKGFNVPLSPFFRARPGPGLSASAP